MTTDTLTISSGFQSILGQDQSIRILTAFLQNDAIPNGLLFAGIDGIGKSSVAILFAMACNCQLRKPAADYHSSVPCGRCRSCRKIMSASHPDVIWIKPGGRHRIKIDQIRELRRILALRPSEAGVRVVIIASAEHMNVAASNALLKILEEPPPHTVFILVTKQMTDLLPTIVSRCQHLRFVPLADQHIRTVLTVQAELDDRQAGVIVAMAGGSAGRALALAGKGNRQSWIARRECLVSLCGASDARFTVTMLLALAQILAEDPDNLPDHLNMMQSWFRDLLICRYAPNQLHHPDLADSLAQAQAEWPVARILDKLDLIEQARQALTTQANARLILERLLIDLNTGN